MNCLECQECGVILRELTPAEEQQIALDPYKFVLYCSLCKAIMLTRIEQEYWS